MSTGKVILVSFLTAVITSSATVVILQRTEVGSLLSVKVRVPALQGLRLDQARLLVEPKELILATAEERHDDEVAAGLILAQTPAEGTEVAPGSRVSVVVSQGPDTLKVPALAQTPLTDAMKALANAELQVGAVTRQPHDTVPPDHVISTIPEESTAVERGTAVNLIVSAGKETVEVPSVRGKWPRAAEEALEEAGLKVGKRQFRFDEDLRPGLVIGQDPAPGEPVAKGSAVDLIINPAD